VTASRPGFLDADAWRLSGPLAPPLRQAAIAVIPVGIAALIELETDVLFWGGLAAATQIAGFIAFDAPARARAAWQVICAPLLGLIAALGVLSTDPALLAVAGMTICGIAGGYCVAGSPRLAIAGMTIVLAFLLAQGFRLDPGDAPRAAAAALAGGLIQALISTAVWALSDRRRESPGLAERVRGARDALARNLDLASPAVRHALRWGIALGASVAIYRFVDLQGHGYWIPLTVLFVLKPSADDTWSRLAMRAVGTIAGLILASALAEALGTSPVPVAIALGIAGAVAYAMLALEYALFTAAITVFVVLLTDSLGEAAWKAADQRALGTVLGIAVAALAVVLTTRGGSETRTQAAQVT
jgi:uncharacterized membrane protein YccC